MEVGAKVLNGSLKLCTRLDEFGGSSRGKGADANVRREERPRSVYAGKNIARIAVSKLILLGRQRYTRLGLKKRVIIIDRGHDDGSLRLPHGMVAYFGEQRIARETDFPI